MMFSFLVCFLVLAAEWWTDSYKKYYKKLYRCRQTFLKPVHMNKWIHEMTCVRFILLPHPHVECKKRHMGKYQTFFIINEMAHQNIFILLCLQIHGTMRSCQMNRKLISQESACYWISKCSVLISNKEVWFVLSWSGYNKWTIMRAIIYLLMLRKWLLVLAKGMKQPKTNKMVI